MPPRKSNSAAKKCDDACIEPWSSIKKYVCPTCTEIRNAVMENKEDPVSEVKMKLSALSIPATSTTPQIPASSFPESPNCCIHALEESLIKWIQDMALICDQLTPDEVVSIAQVSLKEFDGEPFIAEEWFGDFVERNPSLSHCLLLDKVPNNSSLYHAALGQHETTFKSVLSLIALLGVHMRKADLTAIALHCTEALQWQTAFPLLSPGLSWCRRFVTRYPEVERYLYLQNRVVNYSQLDGVELIKVLKPFIDLGRYCLNEMELDYVRKKIPLLKPNQNEEGSDKGTPTEADAEASNDPSGNALDTSGKDTINSSTNTANILSASSAAAALPSQYSSPNKFVRNAIIEDVLTIMRIRGIPCRRDEMRIVVKIIADTFGWRTVYDNNLPSKSWTLRFMEQRPAIREYVDQLSRTSTTNVDSSSPAEIKPSETFLDTNAFHNAVIESLEMSEQAQQHHPEFYTNADEEQ